MLCSMCQHGTTKFWKCSCGDSSCDHIKRCSKCGRHRSELIYDKAFGDKPTMIRLKENEGADLIRNCPMCSFSFGPGWLGIKYDPELPLTPDLERLARIRGILTENRDGAGI